MKSDKTPKQSRLSLWIMGLFVLVSLTILILLQTSNIWKDFTVETASDTLVLYALSSLNFIAFVIFGFIFLRSITKLMRERRTLQLGSKIKSRLLLYFAAVSILPIVAMAGFSYLFMNRALERWFTQIPEGVVVEAREAALAEQNFRLNQSAQMLAVSLTGSGLSEAELQRIREAGNLTLVAVLSRTNKSLVSSAAALPPAQQEQLDATLSTVYGGKIGDPTLSDGKGFDIVVAPMPDGNRLLIVPDLRSDLGVIQKADNWLLEFGTLKREQISVRQIGLLTLGVLTFLLIFASTWIAFYIARGLTVPIKALAEGADQIARGNLAHRVDVLAEDELGLLVAAFNQMTSRLEANSAELLERRRYIETVLESLPTGVISFDDKNRIGTINRAAVGMLRLTGNDPIGSSLGDIVSDENRVILERVIARAKRIGSATEQTALRDEVGEMQVALTATALPGENGAVLVIEDLSELIAAQRASAWQEVARRMAHEIKNPLTPIQLAAERIAKRFAASSQLSVSSRQFGAVIPVAPAEEQMRGVVQDGTATIIREVQSLKAMVDEFARFARLPNANPEAGDLNDVIRQVVGLYEDRLDEITIRTDLSSELPPAMIDAEQLKRVFVNLTDNALEAFDDVQSEKLVSITTRYDAARDLIVTEVSDNGPGIPPIDLQKLFQPYFSTKGRGTGLGLAIVHRIITEHNGRIKAVANHPRGAKFIVELPVAA